MTDPDPECELEISFRSPSARELLQIQLQQGGNRKRLASWTAGSPERVENCKFLMGKIHPTLLPPSPRLRACRSLCDHRLCNIRKTYWIMFYGQSWDEFCEAVIRNSLNYNCKINTWDEPYPAEKALTGKLQTIVVNPKTRKPVFPITTDLGPRGYRSKYRKNRKDWTKRRTLEGMIEIRTRKPRKET